MDVSLGHLGTELTSLMKTHTLKKSSVVKNYYITPYGQIFAKKKSVYKTD